MSTTAAVGPDAGAVEFDGGLVGWGAGTPVGEYYNPNANSGAGEDFLFIGEGNSDGGISPCGESGSSCVAVYNITSVTTTTFPSLAALATLTVASFADAPPSGGFIIDNNCEASSGGCIAGGSEIYFNATDAPTTLTACSGIGGTTSAGDYPCAVQASQAALK